MQPNAPMPMLQVCMYNAHQSNAAAATMPTSAPAPTCALAAPAALSMRACSSALRGVLDGRGGFDQLKSGMRLLAQLVPLTQNSVLSSTLLSTTPSLSATRPRTSSRTRAPLRASGLYRSAKLGRKEWLCAAVRRRQRPFVSPDSSERRAKYAHSGSEAFVWGQL